MGKKINEYLKEDILKEALKCHKIKFCYSKEDDVFILYGDICTISLILDESQDEFLKIDKESEYDLTLIISYGTIFGNILFAIEKIKNYIVLIDKYKYDLLDRRKIDLNTLGKKRNIDEIRRVTALVLKGLREFDDKNNYFIFSENRKEIIKSSMDEFLKLSYFDMDNEQKITLFPSIEYENNRDGIDSSFIAYNHVFIIKYLFNPKSKISLSKDLMLNPNLIKIFIVINPIKEELVARSSCNSWILIDGLRTSIINTDLPRK